MRVKLAALTIAIASLMLLPSRVKADTFVYNVTSTFVGLDVTFDLPTFQETVTNLTTFTTQNTTLDGPVTVFSLSGNSAGCSAMGVVVPTGPCFSGVTATSLPFSTFVSPSFTGPGTFTVSEFGEITTTVTITDVPSGVPEPSSLALLPLGLVALLLVRKRTNHPSAA